EVERAATAHRGRPWASRGFTDLCERAAHPAGILHGPSFSVFAKLSVADGGKERFTAELAGLELLRLRARGPTPTPVAAGVVSIGARALLLLEALSEQPGEYRSTEDLRSIGHVLAALHRVQEERFGLTLLDGFFGPLPQDNRPVPSNSWADYY